jgi:hypothetical protein
LTVLVQHDIGCKWSRFDGEVDADANILSGGVQPGHSDAAKRLSDAYNLHKVAGSSGWFAVRYADGTGGQVLYATRAEAVADRWPWEDQYFYCTLQAPGMSVCAAESVLRFKRVMAAMERPDRDMRGGGLEVIPRAAIEDQEAQIAAVRTGKGALALGYRE